MVVDIRKTINLPSQDEKKERGFFLSKKLNQHSLAKRRQKKREKVDNLLVSELVGG